MYRKIVATFVMLFLISPAWAGSNAFDDMIMKIKVKPDSAAKASGERSFKDRLVFLNGKMSAEERARFGFAATEYETIEASGGSSFSATQNSDSQGTMVWGGNLLGRKIQGTVIWRKKDGRTFTYTFKGVRKD